MSKLKFLFTILILLFSIGAAQAQQDDMEDRDPPPPDAPQQQKRPNLLSELGLTQDQVREIRRINQANRQDQRAAADRVEETRRNLDTAIYSENADDATVKQRLKDFQDAQAEIARIRTNTEFAIRKILTPEQLVRFRELRERFEQFRRERQKQNESPLRMRNLRRGQRNNPNRQQNQ